MVPRNIARVIQACLVLCVFDRSLARVPPPTPRPTSPPARPPGAGLRHLFFCAHRGILIGMSCCRRKRPRCCRSRGFCPRMSGGISAFSRVEAGSTTPYTGESALASSLAYLASPRSHCCCWWWWWWCRRCLSNTFSQYCCRTMLVCI